MKKVYSQARDLEFLQMLIGLALLSTYYKHNWSGILMNLREDLTWGFLPLLGRILHPKL